MDDTVDERVPVLVAGGSLVGLSMSLFLGRLGVPHLVVERHAATSEHPRGRGNNVRTMELLRTAGVEEAVRGAAAVLSGNHGILRADRLTGEREWLFRQIDPGGTLAKFSPTGWCLCSQNDLEPVLLAHARRLGGDIRFNTELTTFRQDADGVTATLCDRATGNTRTVRADYLVGADGPRSPVRERLGIGHSGPGELFHNVSLTFTAKRLAEVVGDDHFIVCYLTDPDGEGALLPVDNDQRWVFHAPWHPERGETLEEFTDERCVRHIRAGTGIRDLEVEVTGRAAWHAAERTADHYRDGRVLLAGDSAHEMSPTGAFGSNTGIQDAHNLAWKLAAVLRGWAGPDLLASYEEERRPVALATGARASERSAEHSHPGYEVPVPSGGGRRPLLPMVLGYGYNSRAVLGADPERTPGTPAFPPSGEPGTRAPHLWMQRGTERISTLDLYERTPVLLVGDGAAGDIWAQASDQLAGRTGVPLVCHRFGVDLMPTGSTDWAQVHGVAAEGAVLVRPDGFVAWRGAQPEGGSPAAGKLLGEVLDSVLCRGAAH